MNKTFSIYSLSSLLILCGGTALAQKNLSEQIDVVRPYKPVLAEALKISYNPEIKVEPNRTGEFEYQVDPKKVDSISKLSVIGAEKMKSEGIAKLYPSYVKLGGGNYATTYAEAFITNTRSQEYLIGTHLKHQASVGSIKNADYSENQVEIFGRRIYKKHALYASFNYDRDVAHFYGYNHDLFSYKRTEVRQHFNYIDMQAGIESHQAQESNALNYRLGVKAYTASDRFKANENSLSLNGLFTKNIAGAPIRLNTGLMFRQNQDSLKSDHHYFVFSPAYTYKQDALSLTLGLNTFTEFGSRSDFHLYPHVILDYTLIEDEMIAFAGITGKLKQNSFRDTYTQNPFIASNQIFLNTNEKMNLFAGIRGNISSKTAYRVQVSYSNLADMPFFVNDTNDLRKFVLVYDGKNTTLLNLSGEFSHQFSDKLRLFGKAEINSYTMDKELEAWHVPLYRIQVSGTYNIADKFLLTADVYGISKSNALIYTPDPTVKELKGIIDANLGIDYRYSKIISIFLKMNNLANTRQEQYLNYKNYGLNGLLGATFSF